MISAIISRLVILVFGTLYPAYASYKAVRTKNLKEYVKWMMYWIVFALFTCTETFTDVFLSWFPFYYEVKIVLVLWLLSPATKGSSILYRKFVHPALCRREQEIDEYIAKAKDQGYHTVLNLGTKGVNYATTVIMQTAIKGGGGLVQQLRKSYSLSDLSECEPREERGGDEADDVMGEPRLIRRGGKSSGFSTRRSASESNSRSPMYFPEVDVDVRSTRSSRTDEPDLSHIKSTEDISSGYSSADNSASLTRTASLGAAARARVRTTRTTTITAVKRPPPAEESEVIIEELQDDDCLEYTNMPPLVNVPSPIYLSHTDPPFIYQYVGDQIKILQVIGDYPLQTKNIETKETQLNKPKSPEESPVNNTVEMKQDEPLENEYVNKEIHTHHPDVGANSETNMVYNNTNIPLENKSNETKDFFLETNVEGKHIDIVDTVTDVESTSLETLISENYSTESDDEASFGTPEDSPKIKRKSPKGKYGKAKAPPPPKLDLPNENSDNRANLECNAATTSQESLNDIINQMPNITESTIKGGLQVVNPIAEKKRRHKSKSPGRIPKSHSSGLGKLLQLPNKLVFWNKNDDKSLKFDNVSTSSGDHSRRSSTVDQQFEEFQSCVNPSFVDDVAEEQVRTYKKLSLNPENINCWEDTRLKTMLSASATIPRAKKSNKRKTQ
ncbi:hypothetical protein evm_001054 [Chilo suppressalis]|nr:hypothetical protein evm_001054 [Chilo suppressalis]